MTNSSDARPLRRGSAAAALLTAALAAGLDVGPSLAQDVPVVSINGRAIMESEVALADTEIGADLGSLPPSTRRRVLVEFLIETQLMAEAAEKAALGRGANVDQRLQYWRRKALRDTFFEIKIKPSVSEADALQAFQAEARQGGEEALKARHILVDTDDQARSIHEEIAHGADFAAMARKHSKDTASRDAGGTLGTFTRGQMVPQFEEAAFRLNRGEVSQPVRSQFGWHIIMVDERVKRKLPPFEAVRKQITAALIHRRAQNVLDDLRAKSKVEYHDLAIRQQIEDERRQGRRRQ